MTHNHLDLLTHNLSLDGRDTFFSTLKQRVNSELQVVVESRESCVFFNPQGKLLINHNMTLLISGTHILLKPSPKR